MRESIAKLNNAKMSAQKVRLVADLVRGLPISKALKILTLSGKKAAKLILKAVESAIANAEHNFGADIDSLKIERIFIDGGISYRRWHARAKSRSCRIIKHSCHITVIVSD